MNLPYKLACCLLVTVKVRSNAMLTKVGWILETPTPSLPSYLRANVEQYSQRPATYSPRTELQEMKIFTAYGHVFFTGPDSISIVIYQ